MQYFQSNEDSVVSILNQCDVRAIISFANTHHLGRKYACLSLANQFCHLINFSKKNCEEINLSCLEKTICARWIKIKCSIDLQSINQKGCFDLKIFKEAFDLLKLFFHNVSPKQQPEVLKLHCQSLIQEMISSDKDEDIWMELDSYPLRVKSVIDELKKFGLFTDGHSENTTFKPLFGRMGATFFNEGTAWKPNFILATYDLNLEKEICQLPFSQERNLKWSNIISLYNKYLDNEKNKGYKVIPLSDFEAETKQCYENICSHIKKKHNFFPDIVTKNTERLKNGQHCFRYSEKGIDIYGNSQFTISWKTFDGKLLHSRFLIETLKSVEDFDILVSEILGRRL